MRQTCLVVGSGPTVWRDVEEFAKIGSYDAVIAVKQAGIHWPGPLRAWVSLHPKWMADFIAQRAANGFPPADEVVTHDEGKAPAPGVDKVFDYYWPGTNKSMASGMAGAKYAAIDLGYKVVLCGIPMTPENRVFGSASNWAREAIKYRERMIPVMNDVRKHVRSMSGWTRERLGVPDAEWLKT